MKKLKNFIEKSAKKAVASFAMISMIAVSFLGTAITTQKVGAVPAPTQMCEAPVDVVMIIDRSGSMDKGTCTIGNIVHEEKFRDWCDLFGGIFTDPRIGAAKDAANSFIDHLGANDQSALISFNLEETLDKELSNDHSLTQDRVDDLIPGGSTDIGPALALAIQELTSLDANPQAVKVIILLADGDSYNSNYVRAQADIAKALGIVVFTIGIGSDIDDALLKYIATDEDSYYHAPNSGDLEGIYEEIRYRTCQLGSISACKYGTDPEGSNQSVEIGWEFTLEGNGYSQTQLTDEYGCTLFVGLSPGPYVLGEGINSGIFEQTYPTADNGTYIIDLLEGEHLTYDFGNYFPICGNGYTDAAWNEECDDKNNVDGDGCSADCQIEGPIYGPYCGDNIVQPELGEQCDPGHLVGGGPQVGCSEQCQPVTGECSEKVFARVVVTDVQNKQGTEGMTDNIFLNTSMLPREAWFIVYDGTSYINDLDINGFEDVPGLAVQRDNGSITVRHYGSHPNNGTQEHGEGYLELYNAGVLDIANDTSGNNRMENWGPDMYNQRAINAGKDAAWIDGNKSYFWMTVTVADDSYFTTYALPPICEEPVYECSDGQDNDGDTLIDSADPGCWTDPQNPQTYDPQDNDEDNDSLPECSDYLDNDGDGDIDENDATCFRNGYYDPTLDDEENKQPVITLTTPTVTITVGDSFDPYGGYATADDVEDGNITPDITETGVVDTSTVGIYPVDYNVDDSEGLAAETKTLTVIVEPVPIPEPYCGDGNCDDGECCSSCPQDCGECEQPTPPTPPTPPSSDGGGIIPLSINNSQTQECVVDGNTATLSWMTNKNSSSQVVCDPNGHNPNWGFAPDWGYSVFTDVFDTPEGVTNHSVEISGLSPGMNYCRIVSRDNNTVFEEVECVMPEVADALTEEIPLAECSCPQLLDTYIQLGADNNPNDVRGLEWALNEMGYPVVMDNVYGINDFAAVSQLQKDNNIAILSPWFLGGSTGYVYYTTQKFINEWYCNDYVGCPREFLLTPKQQVEISWYGMLNK